MAGPVRIAVLEDASHEATITDRGLMSAEDKAKLDDLGSDSTLLSDATPEDIGTADEGVAEEASRADHVHAHGNQLGGSLHANVVAAGAAGFMTGADKTKLDGMFMGTRAIQAGDITATHYDFAVGFAPGKWIVQFRSASGLVLDGVCTDTVAVNGGTNLRVSLAGGGAPALIATDVVTVIAFA